MSFECSVRHAVPGRVRLHVPALALSPPVHEQVRQCVIAVPGVTGVRLNAACASVVIEYDPRRGEVPDHVVRVLEQTSFAEVSNCESASSQRGLRVVATRSGKQRPSVARKLAGRSLLVAGFVGWLLPLIPGTPFFIAGLILLGKGDPLVQYGAKKIGRWRSLMPSNGRQRRERAG